MGNDKETKEKLICSAKKEFLEKGFLKASLRKICADAGLTTGALYFFFEDKEDLFGEIVDEPLETLVTLLLGHFEEEIQGDRERVYLHKTGDHDDVSYKLVHHLYSNYDAFVLLLTKSQGTRYEDCVDRVVEIVEHSYVEMANAMASKQPGMKVNYYMTHWLTHVHVDAFVHLITHEEKEENAQLQMKHMMEFFSSGFMKMALVNSDEIQ